MLNLSSWAGIGIKWRLTVMAHDGGETNMAEANPNRSVDYSFGMKMTVPFGLAWYSMVYFAFFTPFI
jgi:hypothetical protein